MEWWSDGVLECWNNGMMGLSFKNILPSLHHSIAPSLHRIGGSGTTCTCYLCRLRSLQLRASSPSASLPKMVAEVGFEPTMTFWVILAYETRESQAGRLAYFSKLA